MTIERRKHRRCLLRGIAHVQVADQIPRLMGVLEDISLGGLAVYTPEPLPKETEITLDVEVRTPYAEIIRDRLRGKVMWSKEWGSFILHGIQFTDGLTEEHHPDLYLFLKKQNCI